MSRGIRPCAVCGMFYPAEPEELRRAVAALIGRPGGKPAGGEGGLRGIVAPHAGYMYSGPTAGAAYARLAGRRVDTVVVAAPSHREAFAGVSVYPGDAYETPLGRVPIDADFRERLLSAGGPVRAAEAGHRAEHAIEVQLPFLQAVLEEWRLVPLVVGSQTREVCLALGDMLAQLSAGRNVLLVASTDLSHYNPQPVAEKLDAEMLREVGEFDADGVLAAEAEGRGTACGYGALAAALWAARVLGATRSQVVRYATSGAVSGDLDSVVGYGAAVIWK